MSARGQSILVNLYRFCFASFFGGGGGGGGRWVGGRLVGGLFCEFLILNCLKYHSRLRLPKTFKQFFLKVHTVFLTKCTNKLS